jgi:hypothetical protein
MNAPYEKLIVAENEHRECKEYIRTPYYILFRHIYMIWTLNPTLSANVLQAGFTESQDQFPASSRKSLVDVKDRF